MQIWPSTNLMTCRHSIEVTMRRGPHIPWPNRPVVGVRLFKKFLLTLLDPASKNLDHSTLAQTTPAQLMRKAEIVRITQVTLSGETPNGIGHGNLMDPASMNPEQLTSTPTMQDLVNEKIQKLAMKTHLQVQQRIVLKVPEEEESEGGMEERIEAA